MRAGDPGRDGGDQHVAVLDVRQLVGDDALELVLRHVLHDAGGDRDDRVARAPPGRERVGLLVRRDGHDRHRQAGPLAQPVHHRIQLRRLLRGDDLGAVHLQDQLVREEVHHEVEQRCRGPGP